MSQVMNYIINGVLIVVVAQIVNEDVAAKEQSQKTKVQQLDLANKDYLKMIEMNKARSQALNQQHKSTETTAQQDWQGTHHDQVGGLLELRLSQCMPMILTLANCQNVGILTA